MNSEYVQKLVLGDSKLKLHNKLLKRFSLHSYRPFFGGEVPEPSIPTVFHNNFSKTHSRIGIPPCLTAPGQGLQDLRSQLRLRSFTPSRSQGGTKNIFSVGKEVTTEKILRIVQSRQLTALTRTQTLSGEPKELSASPSKASPNTRSKSGRREVLRQVKLLTERPRKLDNTIKRIEEFQNRLTARSVANSKLNYEVFRTRMMKPGGEPLVQQIAKLPECPVSISNSQDTSKKSKEIANSRNSRQITSTTTHKQYRTENRKFLDILQSLEVSKEKKRIRTKRALQRLADSLKYVSQLAKEFDKDGKERSTFLDKILPHTALKHTESADFLKEVKRGNILKVEEMIKKNRLLVFDYDHVGRTALHHAARLNSLEIAELLLKHLADPNCSDISGRTPLLGACQYSSIYMVKLLLRNGASPLLSSKGGMRPEDVAHTVLIKQVLKSCIEARRERRRIKDIQVRELLWNRFCSTVLMPNYRDLEDSTITIHQDCHQKV